MKYVVQYTLPYTHRVMVGIEAEGAEDAIVKAEERFDCGDIWDDTPEVPLLYDDFEESDDGTGLVFEVVQALDEGESWPEPAACVHELRRREAAFTAARMLVEACRHWRETGGVDWVELGQIHDVAMKAVGKAGRR